MISPRYQDTPSERIPEVIEDGKSKVRVIAGVFKGTKAVIETNTPILYLQVELKHPISIGNIMAYMISGKREFGENEEVKSAVEGQLVLFAHDGDSISLRSSVDSSLESGRHSNSMVRYGPFVMNTKEKLYRPFTISANSFSNIAPL